MNYGYIFFLFLRVLKTFSTNTNGILIDYLRKYYNDYCCGEDERKSLTKETIKFMTLANVG